MALVIDATPGSPTANSFATIAEGNAYHEGHMTPDAWTDASTDEKSRALVTATRLLTYHLDWIGRASTSEQALAWPRYAALTRNGYLFASDVVPQAVKDATIELARLLLEGAVTVTVNDLDELKAGPISLKFRNDADAPEPSPLPDSVYQMVKFLAARDSVSNDAVYHVPIQRT
jgi:hypothetical protein